MADNKLPKIGQRVVLVHHQKNGEQKKYVSQILDVLDDNHFKLAIPLSRGMLVPIMNESTIMVEYAIEDVGIFEFQCVVKNKSKEDIPFLEVERNSSVEKNQRRNFFRVPISIPVTIIRINEKDSLNLMSKDLSGGGIRVLSEIEFEDHELVRIIFELNEKRFSLDGKVARVYKDDNAKKYEIAMEFTNIVEKERNEIISFLFYKQRIMMKPR